MAGEDLHQSELLAIWAGRRYRQSYQGRSKTYLAVGRKVLESWVAKLKRDLYSTEPWFEVQPIRDVFQERARAIHALYDHFIRTQMQVRRKAGPHLRQLVTYGTAPVHISWRSDEESLPVLRESLEDGGPKAHAAVEKVLRYYGPTMRVVDLFSWYIYPTTCLDVADAELVFEDQLTNADRLIDLSTTPCSPKHPDQGMLVHFYLLS